MLVKSSVPPGADQGIERGGQQIGVRIAVGVDAADSVADRQLAEQLIVGQWPRISPCGGSKRKFWPALAPSMPGRWACRARSIRSGRSANSARKLSPHGRFGKLRSAENAGSLGILGAEDEIPLTDHLPRNLTVQKPLPLLPQRTPPKVAMLGPTGPRRPAATNR